MTFQIEGAGQAFFFVFAFAGVALIFILGPRRRRADAPWFGAACLGFSAYAAVAYLFEPPWPMIAAASAAALGVVGFIERFRKHG